MPGKRSVGAAYDLHFDDVVRGIPVFALLGPIFLRSDLSHYSTISLMKKRHGNPHSQPM